MRPTTTRAATGRTRKIAEWFLLTSAGVLVSEVIHTALHQLVALNPYGSGASKDERAKMDLLDIWGETHSDIEFPDFYIAGSGRVNWSKLNQVCDRLDEGLSRSDPGASTVFQTEFLGWFDMLAEGDRIALCSALVVDPS
jgi:hypothetical protein